MAMELGKVGATSKTHTHAYDWKNQATYALGIGARRDELAYLYEKYEGGMKVYPTYAVVPAFEAVIELLNVANVDFAMVVHGAQKLRAHQPLPPSGTLETVGSLRGVYDMKKFASLSIETVSTVGGESVVECDWTIIVRGAGSFGGARPPADEEAIRKPKDRPADWVVEQSTSEEQALLYRLSGDINPLHADPVFAKKVGFEQGPILHGLCTYGHVARAVIGQLAGGDAERLQALSAQFRKPVWPGDTIVTSGWDVGGGKVALQAVVKERPDPVVTNAWAQIKQD